MNAPVDNQGAFEKVFDYLSVQVHFAIDQGVHVASPTELATYSVGEEQLCIY